MININEIRILPMSNKDYESKTEYDARKFLSTALIERDGKYYYKSRAINIKDKYALILFQYNNTIIGYGVLEDIVRNPITEMADNKTIGYNGYLQFLTITIHNIHNIALQEIQAIDNAITSFSNAKQQIDIKYYYKIYELLLQKQLKYNKSKV